MTLERYADWLARGRAHQAEGRVIDAYLCYRRALREVSGGVDARFHVGEIAWHLGNQADAIAAWEAAVDLSPTHRPSLHALADAFAATGQFEASLRAADRILALRSREPRANALSIMNRTAIGHASDDAGLADAIQLNPQWPLALVSAVCVYVLSEGRLAHYPRAMPRVLDAAASASVTVQTLDRLRDIALALARAGQTPRSETFAGYYAQSCRALHQPTMPLLWPLRTAGGHVRAGLLVASEQVPDAKGMVAWINERLAGQCRARVFALPATPGPLDLGASPDVRTLPLDPDAAARAVALLDLDVLIDLAGVRAPSGPLLAWRPARAIWSVKADGVPVAPLLADRIFAIDPAELAPAIANALDAMHGEVTARPTSAISADDMAARWDNAVRAHQQRDAAVAKTAYAGVLDTQPDFRPALYLAGLLARAENDTDTARERLRAAVRGTPVFVDAVAALADLEAAAGNAAEGAMIARQGLEASQASALLWRALGQAELKRRDGDAAARAFVEALERDPGHGETHYNHGVALQMTRDAAGLLAPISAHWHSGPTFMPPISISASFSISRATPTAAIAAFSKVLERDPAHVAAYRALAETLLASGRVDAWFANFDRFERHCPTTWRSRRTRWRSVRTAPTLPRLARYLDGLRHERFAAGEPDEVARRTAAASLSAALFRRRAGADRAPRADARRDDAQPLRRAASGPAVERGRANCASGTCPATSATTSWAR